MIDAPETGETVQVQAVPCPPVDIRRVEVPIGTQAAANSAPGAGSQMVDDLGALSDAASGTPLGSLTNGPGSFAGPSVEIGKISVPSEYAGLIEQASAKTGTPAPLLAAILYNESRFQPNVVSSAGAEGIAQFMPATAAANDVSPFEPASAIPGAASLLAQFHEAFGSWTDAVAAYAAGGGAVEAAGGVPNDGSTPAYVASALAEAGMAEGS
jgi:soluble lytic murein transglycosylase-like protein